MKLRGVGFGTSTALYVAIVVICFCLSQTEAARDMCSYCRFCTFCPKCEKDCPCTDKSECKFCKYCPYCTGCSWCDQLCSDTGLISDLRNSVLGEFAGSVSSRVMDLLGLPEPDYSALDTELRTLPSRLRRPSPTPSPKKAKAKDEL